MRSGYGKETFQHVQLVPEMSVLENVALGAHWRTSAGFTRSLLALDDVEKASNSRHWRRAWTPRLSRSALPKKLISRPEACRSASNVSSRSPALWWPSRRILRLLDEPAAGLRFSEKLMLVKILRQLQADQVTILLVEHDMEASDGMRAAPCRRSIADGSSLKARRDNVQNKSGGHRCLSWWKP